MISNEEAKMLLTFRGVSGLNLKIVLAHEGGPTILLTRDDERSPWAMAAPCFGGIFDEILEPFIGKFDEGIAIKQEIQGKIYDATIKSCKPYIDNNLERIRATVKKAEDMVTINVTDELLDIMRNVASKVINPVLESPFMDDPDYADDKKQLEMFKILLANDYPAGIRKYRKILEFMETTEEKIQKSANLNENNKKILVNFQQNTEVFKTKFQVRDTRKLKESFNAVETAKALFEETFEDVDQLVGAIR